MKKLLWLLIFIGCSVVGFGQNDSTLIIKGIVYDMQTADSLSSINIFIKHQDNQYFDVVQTSKNGKYQLNVDKVGCYFVRIIDINNRLEKVESVNLQGTVCIDSSEFNVRQDLYTIPRYFYNSGCTDQAPYPFCKSEKLDFEIIIQDKNGNLIENSLFYFSPIKQFKNIDHFFSNQNDGNIQLPIFQHIEYQLLIAKKGYEIYDEIVVFNSKKTKIISITLKKIN